MARHDAGDDADRPIESEPTRLGALDQELETSCGLVLEGLGLELDASDRELVVRKSIEFFEDRFETRYRNLDWEGLAVRRELLLVLAGGLFGTAIERSLDRLGETEQRRVAELVAKEISTPRRGCEDLSPVRRKLDPLCWSLEALESDDERMLHLSLLAEAARLQEDALVGGGEPPILDLEDALRLGLDSVTLEA